LQAAEHAPIGVAVAVDNGEKDGLCLWWIRRAVGERATRIDFATNATGVEALRLDIEALLLVGQFFTLDILLLFNRMGPLSASSFAQ
jgi:hypothetical protein